VQVEASSPSLEEFTSEADLPRVRPTPVSIGRSRMPDQWAGIAASAVLAIIAAVGVPAWYRHLQIVHNEVVTMPQPPDPPHIVLAPWRPSVQPADADPLQTDGTGSPAAATTEDGAYSIVVASFTSATRAQQLVDELTNAGYRAHAVERDWGPPRGRLVQVNVGGYTSATDVARDLQQIRELPGGYQDARIVERP
jgi:cell division septation protein DedD